MDRQSHGLDRGSEEGQEPGSASVSLIRNEEFMLRKSAERLAMPQKLFALEELDVYYDDDNCALWTFMRPKARPSFTPPMLADFEQWQSLIVHGFGPGQTPLNFLILGSRAPGVFCFGGDLQLFAELIRSGDRSGLVRYGNRCVDILDRNIRALNLPMLTIGLVQGEGQSSNSATTVPSARSEYRASSGKSFNRTVSVCPPNTACQGISKSSVAVHAMGVSMRVSGCVV